MWPLLAPLASPLLVMMSNNYLPYEPRLRLGCDLLVVIILLKEAASMVYVRARM